MQSAPASKSFMPIPWYWAPYICLLGLADWYAEIRGVTHREAIRTGLQNVKKSRHKIFRIISSGILILAIYMFVAKWIFAPLLNESGFRPSNAVSLWGSALIALLSLVLLLRIFILGAKRSLRAVYARGLRSLLARHGNLVATPRQLN